MFSVIEIQMTIIAIKYKNNVYTLYSFFNTWYQDFFAMEKPAVGKTNSPAISVLIKVIVNVVDMTPVCRERCVYRACRQRPPD